MHKMVGRCKMCKLCFRYEVTHGSYLQVENLISTQSFLVLLLYKTR